MHRAWNVAGAALCMAWQWWATGHACAQDFPVKPIRIIAPAVPGGGIDIQSRIIAARLAEVFGRPVLVDNRAGGGGTIGTDIVAKAAPDGYTLVMASTSHVSNPALIAKMPYDTVKDFASVTLVSYVPLVLVLHPSVPVKTVKELIAFAKARPGKLNYASGGNGFGAHLAGELFKYTTGTDIVHIPYKGNAPGLTDTLAGQTALMFDTIITCLPYVKADRLKGLAVTTLKRSSLATDMPTMHESGLPGFEISAWYGILATAGTPKDVIARLNAEIVKILRAPDLKERFTSQGADIVASTPEELDTYVRTSIAKWQKVLAAAGIRAD
jgi:tripartite-type tricarboxylate transporter receptor subunit TctC